MLRERRVFKPNGRGRIRSLVTLTVYKGKYQYGKRSKKHDIWEVDAPRLVSDEMWKAAQEALAHNPVIAKNNTTRHYLLTGLIKCGECGKTYRAAHGRDNILVALQWSNDLPL